MKNATLNLKLKKYSAAAAAVAAAAPAIGQVVYTDLVPDIGLTTGAQYNMDLNADSVIDFYFSHFMQTGTYYGGLINYSINAGGMLPASGNGFVGATSTIGTMVSGLYAGVPIGSSLSFLSGYGLLGGYAVVSGIYSTSLPVGDFNPVERFAALRFDIGGNTHYGWARCEVFPDGSQTIIKDYAYNATPNTPINSGDSGMGTASIEDGDISDLVKVIQSRDGLMINIAPELGNVKLRVMDMTGALVLETGLNAGMNTPSFEGSAGIYFVSVTSDQGVFSQKIYR